MSVIIQQIDISLKARCRHGKRNKKEKKRKKNLVGVGNKETTEKKEETRAMESREYGKA